VFSNLFQKTLFCGISVKEWTEKIDYLDR